MSLIAGLSDITKYNLFYVNLNKDFNTTRGMTEISFATKKTNNKIYCPKNIFTFKVSFVSQKL